MKILFAVHRYYPYPGGSEFFTRDMAEEMLGRGHDVTVLADTHQGNQNGVKVTKDYNHLFGKWDLIIVHGCDCNTQNIVLANSAIIKSPICYMIIKPSNSYVAKFGMAFSRFVAYSTTADMDHINSQPEPYSIMLKSRRIRHGIVPKNSIALNANDHKGNFYVSAGGFYPHKAMTQLAKVWHQTGQKFHLELYGYADGDKPSYPNVQSHLGMERSIMLSSMANSKGYIMNSYEEGFGLVLLEAMLNRVPCYARNIAGAKDMKPHVITYESEYELLVKIEQYESLPSEKKRDILENNYEYVMGNHTITQTCNDIEDILGEL